MEATAETAGTRRTSGKSGKAAKNPANGRGETLVKANAFEVRTMAKIPAALLTNSRNEYGWADLDKPKKFKTFARDKYTLARASAYAFAAKHDMVLKSMAATDDDGKVVTEKVYYVDGVETPKAEAVAMGEGKYTVKDEPKEYWIVRIS